MLDFCLTFGVHFTSTGQFLSKDRYEGDTSNPITLHKYLYAHGNPVTYEDPSGYSPLGVVVGVLSMVGIRKEEVMAKLPSLGVALAVAISWGRAVQSQHELLNIFEGMSTGIDLESIYDEAIRVAEGDSADKAKENATAVEATKGRSNSTVIYRKGSGNGTNLTPRVVDITGLSYTTIEPVGTSYTMTTIEAINATGQLIAIQDGSTHVSIVPINITKLPEWINSRPNAKVNPHPYTIILQRISQKVKK